MDAKAILDALLARLGGQKLCHPRLQVGALAGVLHPRRLASQEPRRLDLGRHVGELELDRLVLGDWLAEGLSLLAVAQRQLQSPLGDTNAAGRDVDPADLER